MTNDAKTRTDVHRPSALVTEDYEYLYAADTAASGWAAPLVDSGFIKELINYDPSTAERGSSQCHHCGAHLRYVAWLRYIPTGHTICVGETCLENRFERATADFHRLRKQAELDRHAQRIRKAITKFVVQNADLVWMLDEGHVDDTRCPQASKDNEFIHDVARKLRKYGELSDKQVAAVRRAVVKDAERAARYAAEAAEPREPVSAGRQQITGEVLSTKWVDNDFGGSLKMLVKDSRGFKVWGTVPSAIDPQRGDVVSFAGTISPSHDDEFFGFYKRPAKATILKVAQ